MLGWDRACGLGPGWCPWAGDRFMPQVLEGRMMPVCAVPNATPTRWGTEGPRCWAPLAPLTLALVLDGEAEDVAGAEAGAVVHPPVEERVRVGILDVEDLASGGHVPCDALVRWYADLVALRVGGQRRGPGWGTGPCATPPRSPQNSMVSAPHSPHHPPHHHQILWPPAHG